MCASCWVHFLPAPNSDGASTLTIASDPQANTSEVPFVWSNRARANLQQDQFVRSPQSYAEDQAGYQRVWLLGKLGLLADVRSLHAAQSIDPRELVQLRAWLSHHDRQQVQQPEVDRVLRELGVTHRLIRSQPASKEPTIKQSSHPTQFTWQAIVDPLPLCQVVVSRAVTFSAASGVSWRWTNPDRLAIQIPGLGVNHRQSSVIVANQTDGEPRAIFAHDAAEMDDAVLLVRQINDGGWLAHDATGRQLAIRREPLFVEVELPDALGELTLSRKWFW